MTAKTLSVLIASALLLAGCGNKGPLMLPPAPVDGDVPLLDVPPSMADPDASAAEVLMDADAETDADADVDADPSEPDPLPDPPAAAAAR